MPAPTKATKTTSLSLRCDVKGAELAVLRGFSIERYRPRLIMIEDDVESRAKHNYLKAHGYKLVRRTALNTDD